MCSTCMLSTLTWCHVFRLQADPSVLTVGAREPGGGGQRWLPPHRRVGIHIVLEKLFLEAQSRTNTGVSYGWGWEEEAKTGGAEREKQSETIKKGLFSFY